MAEPQDTSSNSTPVALATVAYVLGWTAHVTFIFYLAPLALREADAAEFDAWVFTGTALASILALFPAGRLVDLWPRRRVLRAGLALLAASYAPLLLPPSLAGVLVATALTGTGLALLLVSFNAYLADLLASAGMSAAYGRTTALAILAGAIGPFLAAAIFGALPDASAAIRANAALFGAGAVGATALTFALPAVRSSRAQPQATGGLLHALRSERATILPAALVFLLAGIGAGATSPYFAVYFLDTLDAPPAQWGILLGFGTAASATGSFLVGRIGRHVEPMRLILAPQALLVLASLPFLLPFSTFVLGFTYAVRSLFLFTLSPLLNTIMMARVGPLVRGRTQAWSNLAWNIGWASGAAAGGAALAALGGALFLLGALVSFAGVALGAALFRRG